MGTSVLAFQTSWSHESGDRHTGRFMGKDVPTAKNEAEAKEAREAACKRLSRAAATKREQEAKHAKETAARNASALKAKRGARPPQFLSNLLFFGGGLVILVASYFVGGKVLMWWSGPSEVADAADDAADAFFHDSLDIVRSALLPEGGAARKPGHGRFGEASYWEERYTKSKSEMFDWYGTWAGGGKITLKPHVGKYVKHTSAVLNVGCGNSRFAEELSDDGFQDVVSIDIAHSVIEKMQKKFGGRPGLKFQQMDASQMTFPDASFDSVFEKGTLDALYAGAAEVVVPVVQQVFRVLRPGGLFVSIGFGTPPARKQLNTTGVVWSRFQLAEVQKEDGGIIHIYQMWK